MSCKNKKREKGIHKELKNKKLLYECAKRFDLVGDLTKMKICWLLCHHKELSVSEIAEILKVSPSLVSHALRRLQKMEMVLKRRDGKRNMYQFSDKTFKKFLLTLVNSYGRKI